MPTERVLGDNAGVAGLIRCIYDAALDARRWSDFLARFCVTFSSDAALIFGQDFSSQTVEVTGGPTQLAAHHGFSDSAIRDFGAHYCHGNVWTSDERLHREGCVVVGAQLYPEKYLLRTEWGDWMHSQDLFHTFAAVVEKREQRSFNLSGLRSQRGGPYSDAEQARLYGLMPHLQTAFALHRRLHRTEALAQASLAVLDGLPIGVVLLGEQARVLHANTRAHHMLQRSGLLRLGADEYLHAAAANDALVGGYGSRPADQRWYGHAFERPGWRATAALGDTAAAVVAAVWPVRCGCGFHQRPGSQAAVHGTSFARLVWHDTCRGPFDAGAGPWPEFAGIRGASRAVVPHRAQPAQSRSGQSGRRAPG